MQMNDSGGPEHEIDRQIDRQPEREREREPFLIPIHRVCNEFIVPDKPAIRMACLKKNREIKNVVNKKNDSSMNKEL